MKTIEGNKLIAEFMLKQKPTNEFCVSSRDKEGFDIYIGQSTNYFPNEHLRFQFSWDWLMPVIGLISDECEEPEELDGLKYALLTNNIEEAWIFVTDYLENR